MAGSRTRRLAREPLLHFAVLGALVFGVQRALPSPGDPDPVIRVDAATQARVAQQLRDALGRAPTDAEREAAVERYVDQQLLYREGLALGLDRDDPVVRRRVIQKMEFVATHLELPDDPDDATLQRFMLDYPERYAGPPRVDFELVTVPPSADADARARDMLERLRGGADPRSVGGRYARGTRFPAVDLARTYGPQLGAAIIERPVGQWSALATSARSWTLVRPTARYPGQTPPLHEIRGRVRLDWRTSRRAAALRERLDAMRREVRVELAPRDPPAAAAEPRG